jgi:hypothetical protein
MKKRTLGLMAIVLTLTFQPLQSNATINTTPSSLAVSKAESVEAEALLFRLNEINNMDKSGLKQSDKKNLRIEVRSIKQKLSATGGGIYISAGAVIIIILLLIILL